MNWDGFSQLFITVTIELYMYTGIKKRDKSNWPFEIVNAGDHCDRKISKQILPLLFILGWYIRVVKATCNKAWVSVLGHFIFNIKVLVRHYNIYELFAQ